MQLPNLQVKRYLIILLSKTIKQFNYVIIRNVAERVKEELSCTKFTKRMFIAT